MDEELDAAQQAPQLVASGGVPVSASVEENQLCRSRMLDRVARSDGHFKHQQRDEPDLTFSQKLAIATEILDSKPSVFLTRFGKFLESEDLDNFESMKNDYVVGFQLEEIKKRLNVHANQTIVKNRRYEAMKKLVEEGEYFGDDALKERDPLLYEQMVGQYLDAEEIGERIDKADLSLSSVLISHMDVMRNNQLYEKQKETEESQMMEADSDSEKGKADNSDDESEEESELESEEEEEEKKPKISAEEKLMLRDEFMKTMQHRFLSGEDQDFDYTKVDTNEEYDSLDIREHDEQERYFDDEDPENVDTMDTDDSNSLPPCLIPHGKPKVGEDKPANLMSQATGEQSSKTDKSSPSEIIDSQKLGTDSQPTTVTDAQER